MTSDPSSNGHVDKPKVLCPEKLSPDGLSMLRKTLHVDEVSKLTPEQLIEIIPQYDALLVRSETKVTKELLAAAKNLKVVARAGVGVDNVDVPAATKLGIVVVNSPSGNIQAAAEHTIALLMSMARKVPEACASMKAGKWERSKFVGVEVKGKTLGIIGLGKVGLIVARMARGLGMSVAAMDPYASPAVAEAANVSLVGSLNALLPQCDFLTIHTPMLASTRGMLSTDEIALLKKGARVLNVARGGIVDEPALLAALESGHLAGAAIDVFTSEPPKISDNPDSALTKLLLHPNCICTPHLGASTVEAQENVSLDVCEQVLQILAGDLPRSAVNAPIIVPKEYKTLQPFVRLVEKMGSLYTQHFSQPIAGVPGGEKTVQHRNTFDLIYEGELAGMSSTKPLFAALIKGLVSPISDGLSNVNIVNAEMVAKERGIFVNEQKSRDPGFSGQGQGGFSSLVTLVARSSSRAPSLSRHDSYLGPDGKDGGSRVKADRQHVISGYCSDNTPFISRLDRFSTNFVPEGHLLICHNYDSPGKIGQVGSILGREEVNINYMSVAPASFGAGAKTGMEAVNQRLAGLRREGSAFGNTTNSGTQTPQTPKEPTEALMILGVDREPAAEVVKELIGTGGVLSVSGVVL
ncbi:D-3-phosphoglycerate dehydrogenase 2, chloroplastic [Cyphellophora attinorum]|uniref:D-3-phosphoglycerate dehydrogenase n=1 Tax=Cyphellophora attinorum TaxID=1664694 RepID=A0A0N1P145_9EURO|nr:D-3-phosphoglycerate dehydrogenase 2, chloroplastic [Phialophora attinorum]KPI40123.1 D-3-phosphoglycerate dehydrogenase 2, chloroplastic [Phialophora attinorum]